MPLFLANSNFNAGNPLSPKGRSAPCLDGDILRVREAVFQTSLERWERGIQTNPVWQVSVTVLHDNICAKMLHGYPWDSRGKTMLCAGGEDKDACQVKLFTIHYWFAVMISVFNLLRAGGQRRAPGVRAGRRPGLLHSRRRQLGRRLRHRGHPRYTQRRLSSFFSLHKIFFPFYLTLSPWNSNSAFPRSLHKCEEIQLLDPGHHGRKVTTTED